MPRDCLEALEAPYVAGQEVFNRLLSLDGVEPQEVERIDVATSV
jgi:hypothetical protein